MKIRPYSVQSAWLLAAFLPTLFLSALAFIQLTGSKVTFFVWLNYWMHGMPEAFWANITFLADTAAVGGLAGLFLLRKERLVMGAIVGGIVCGIIIRLLKIYFDEPRPPAVLNGSLFNVIGEAYRGKSFPSGHAATAMFAAALVLAYWRSRQVYVLALLFGLLGAFSRIAVGVHWPTDILLGGSIGWIIGFGSGLFFSKRSYFNYPKRILVCLFSYAAAVYLLIYDPHMPHVMWLQGGIAAAGLYCSLHYLAFRILKV